MKKLFLGFIVWSVANGVLFIDRLTLDTNPAIVNVTVTYEHDVKRNAVDNVTFDVIVTVTKVLAYLEVRFAGKCSATFW